MYYLFVNVQNTSSQTMTLNDVQYLSKDNMFVTNDCMTLLANSTDATAVAGYSYASGGMRYNITEEMVLDIQWTFSDETAPPTSFSASISGGTEYMTSYGDPVISADPDDTKWTFYTYTVTVALATSS